MRLGEAHCEIFSVDTDHRLVVPWQDIRYLPQALCVEPAFYVDARATVQAARLPVDGRTFVEDRLLEESSYEIVMKRHDICVNGSMVKEGFAVSSGSESAVVERIKEVIP
ncbi:hypothetical protein quinque_013881 [Culex quinquefasciatus]